MECEKLDDLGVREQVCRLGKYLKHNTNSCPAHLQHKLRELDDLLVHSSACEQQQQQVCEYPKCYEGKLLYRHLFFCEERICRLCKYPNCFRGTLTLRFRHKLILCKKTHTCHLCKSMMRLLKFHARACTLSNCIVPRCSEIREEKLEKERRFTGIEERLKRLRRLEPRRAAAAAALQLSLQLSLKKKKGKEEEKKKELKQEETNCEKMRRCSLLFC